MRSKAHDPLSRIKGLGHVNQLLDRSELEYV